MLPSLVPLRFRPLPKLAALAVGLAAFTWAAAARSHTEADVPESGQEKAAVAVTAASQDSERLEKALQGLPWDQFKTVVTAIPKLKADVDAYGPLGWQYVQANYKTYPWRKSINKLQDPQKKRLSEMIDEVRAGTKPAPQQP